MSFGLEEDVDMFLRYSDKSSIIFGNFELFDLKALINHLSFVEAWFQIVISGNLVDFMLSQSWLYINHIE